MGSPRAIRIPTGRPAEPGPAPVDAATSSGTGERPNHDGTQRAVRSFLLFLALLIAIDAAVLLTFLTSPDEGVRTDLGGYGFFTLAFAAAAVAGSLLTLGRAPRALGRDGRFLLVRPRVGAPLRFPWDAGLSVETLRSYPAGFFSDGPTELVRVAHASGKAAVLLIERGLRPVPPTGEGSAPTTGPA